MTIEHMLSCVVEVCDIDTHTHYIHLHINKQSFVLAKVLAKQHFPSRLEHTVNE